MKTEWLCRGMALDDAAIAWESAVRCRPEDPTEEYLSGLDWRLEEYRRLLLEQAGAVRRVLSRLPPPREEADDIPEEEAGQGEPLPMAQDVMAVPRPNGHLRVIPTPHSDTSCLAPQGQTDPPEKIAGAYRTGEAFLKQEM
jgi:hypothetical protein